MEDILLADGHCKTGEILSFYLVSKENYYVIRKKDSAYVNRENWILLFSFRNSGDVLFFFFFFFWLALFIPLFLLGKGSGFGFLNFFVLSAIF